MEAEILKKLSKDPNGLMTYEFIANHIDSEDIDMAELVKNIIQVDSTGQFVVSTARYLNAIDASKYEDSVDVLIKAAINVDREHKYIGDLLASIWGVDYEEHLDELKAADDNFRRIYKRVFPIGI